VTGLHELSPAESAARHRSRMVNAVRMTFFVLLLTVTLLNVISVSERAGGSGAGQAGWLAERWYIPLSAALALFVVFLAVDLLTPRKKIATLSAVVFGLMAGMLATIAFGFVIDLVAESWDFAEPKEIVGTIKVLVGVSLCYLGISTVLQTQDDFRLVIPYVEFAKQMRGTRPLLLDTSALIDGRVVDVAGTGFVQAPVLIPQFVVQELQTLADSRDGMKRARGRRGLEVVSRLQRSVLVDVSIDEAPVPGMGVDQMLVERARQLPAVIVTTDTGLARVAGIHNVPVLNLNDLANALKPSVLPGETLRVQVMKRGEQRSQGVGYMPDGTMVVVEDGAERVGSEVEAVVTSSLQTSAGRMIFARLEGSAEPERAAPEAERAEAVSEEAAVERGPFPPHGPARANRKRNPRR